MIYGQRRSGLREPFRQHFIPTIVTKVFPVSFLGRYGLMFRAALRTVTKLARGRSTAFWATFPRTICLYSRPSVDIIQANYVVLIELAKGYLEDPHRSVASSRKAVHCCTGDKDPFPRLRMDDCIPQLDFGPLIQHHP